MGLFPAYKTIENGWSRNILLHWLNGGLHKRQGKAINNLSAQNPLKRMASPQDIANAVLWLCSSMSAHVNGDVIFVDGGGSLGS